MLGPRGGKQLTTFARIGAVGIELAASTVIGFLAGHWLDQKLDTGPYLGLIGLLLGVIAGFRSLIETAKREAERAKREAERQNEAQGSEQDEDKR